MKAIILEVLTFVGSLEFEAIVGNEGVSTQSRFSPISTGDSTNVFGVAFLTEVNSMFTVSLVL